MDQIEIKQKNLSIKKSFILIVFLMIILVASLSAVTVWWCISGQQKLTSSRGIVISNYNISGTKENNSILIQPENYKYKELSAKQNLFYSIYNVGIILLPIIYLTIGIICSASLFYKIKLKHPIKLLEQSAAKVAENDLDFSISYNSNDEMGKLCNSFEKMRRELYQNNQSMWKMIKERKQLYASMNHDLRTPITVVKGYTEFLHKNILRGKVSEKKLLDTLKNITDSVNRLEKYVDSVRDIQRMEEMELHLETVSLISYLQELMDNMSVLASKNDKILTISFEHETKNITLDKQMLSRILENTIGNAIRYAKKNIKVSCYLKEDQLHFDIMDDGKGFSMDDLKEACRPFYTDDGESGHVGIGLATCKTLCEKHGGVFLLSNQQDSGAKVSFYILISNY